MAKFVTKQVPINLVKGSSTDATEIYVGDFQQMLVGLRTGSHLEVSRQAADGSGSAFSDLQVWIRAYLRTDLVLAKADHFVVIDGIIPA